MGQSRPLFVYFCYFLDTISIQIEKSVDGVLGIRTRGRRMVGADDTTELGWPLYLNILSFMERGILAIGVLLANAINKMRSSISMITVSSIGLAL